MQLGHAQGSAAVSLRPEPLGVLLLVVSGNVFTGPAEALMAALCTRNAAIVKRPGVGGEFVDLFVESLEEAAPDLAAAVALLSWKGGTGAVERPLAERVDGIVVAGDGETIAAYRRLAPATTPLVEFGPRVSVAIVSRGGIDGLAIDRLALDIARWDQLACSAAQVVYVEGEEEAMSTAARLAEALARLERSLPAGAVTIDERIEVARLRQEATFAESQGDARVFAADGVVATVVFERDPRFRPSPLGRSVRVKPYRHLDDLVLGAGPGAAPASHDRPGRKRDERAGLRGHARRRGRTPFVRHRQHERARGRRRARRHAGTAASRALGRVRPMTTSVRLAEPESSLGPSL